MASKRVELAAALAAAGLDERANELLREELGDVIGFRPNTPAENEARARADRSDEIRKRLGLEPRPPRKRRARPGVGRLRIKLARMLVELGWPVTPEQIRPSIGWHRSIHKLRDDTTLTWDAHVTRKIEVKLEGKTHEIDEDVHLISWERIGDCVRYGIVVHPLHGRHQQCVSLRGVKK